MKLKDNIITFETTNIYMKQITSLSSLIDILTLSEKEEYSEIVKRIKIPTKEFLKFASWNKEKYTRNCLFRNEDFELLLLCWEPKQKTPIHNHNEQECWVYLVQGKMTEQRCVLNKNQQFVAHEKEEMNVEGAYYINDDIGFHSLENSNDSKRSISLHLYAKPIEKCVFYDEKAECFREVELEYSSVNETNFSK